MNPAELDDLIEPGLSTRDRISLAPASIGAAQAERAELAASILEIDGQLIGRKPADFVEQEDWLAYRRWEQRAKVAKNWKVQRLSFLKSWLHDQVSQQRTDKAAVKIAAADKIADVPLTAVLRASADRVGHLEAVYLAVCAYIEDDTDASWEELLARVDRARPILDGTPIHGDSQ